MPALTDSFDSLPCATSCRRVDFDLVELRETTHPGGPLLLVSGIKPWADLRVTLEPIVYRELPEYWQIEVVGRLSASALPVWSDYCAVLRLAAFLGCRGIEVVGATRVERHVLGQWGHPARHARSIC